MAESRALSPPSDTPHRDDSTQNVALQKDIRERDNASTGNDLDAPGLSVKQDGSKIEPSQEPQGKAEETVVPNVAISESHEYSQEINTDATSNPQSEFPLGKEGPSIELSKAPPRSMEGNVVLSESDLRITATIETSTPATIQLPSSGIKEQQVPSSREIEKEAPQDSEDATALSNDRLVQTNDKTSGNLLLHESVHHLPKDHSSGTLHQYLGKASVDNGEVKQAASSQPPTNGILRSQMNIVKTDDAFTGTPSTPDEQLRLEEAQALQTSMLNSHISKEIGKNENASQVSAAAHDKETLRSHNEPMTDEQQLVEIAASFSNVNPRSSEPAGREIEMDHSSETPTPGLREHTFPGMTGSLSKDLTLSRRPPMRIDTAVPSANDSIRSFPSRKATREVEGGNAPVKLSPNAVAPSTPSETVKSSRSGPPTSQIQSPPERMITRVSSGALRHKSVSEILGETPRHSAFHNDKASTERAASADEHALHTPKSAASLTLPDAAAFKQRLNRLDEKDKSKPSTVVFVRQTSSSGYRRGETASNPDGDLGEGGAEPKDYLLPLFAAQAIAPSQFQQLHSLVLSAHKTLTTADHCTDFQEQQDCRILTRIYQLQNTGRWSLRQHDRSVEPGRPTAHWDVLLSQMRWMRTDFREERKWKLAAAKGLADVCARWVTSSVDERASLQVKVRPPSTSMDSTVLYMQTPELVPSREDDSSDVTDFESSDFEASKRNAPARIFSLPPDMFVFGLDRTPIADKILSELPLYQPSVKTQDTALNRSSRVLEDAYRTSVIPFSKFVEGKMLTREQGPTRKKSRFDYSDVQEDTHASDNPFDDCLNPESGDLGPEQDDVALFRHEKQHIRDRIHAGHAFRPPSEHGMPSQGFFESRQSSQWTQYEDDELRRLVREYAYNWSLISSCISTPSLFSSAAERRTPWECFERWVGLEGLPGEMSKTQYFKAYHSRLHAAQRTPEGQQHTLQQHQGNNIAQIPMRRRTTLPFLVDRRKNNRHLHLVDAMRKLAKKRETAVHKQQHGMCELDFWVPVLLGMRSFMDVIRPVIAR